MTVLEAAQRKPALKAQHAHPGVRPVQPALECCGSFPGLPDADISGVLGCDSAADFTAVHRFSQSTGMKNMERKRGNQGERERVEVASSPAIQKPSL